MSIDILEIQSLIPHRYPFLLIDRIIEAHEDQKGVAIKNVTVNEPFFNGHFPRNPVMPGVLQLEAMAQTAAALVAKHFGYNKDNLGVYFMSAESVKFRDKVVPGDQLVITVEKVQNRSNVWKYKGTIHVNNKLVSESIFTAVLKQ